MCGENGLNSISLPRSSGSPPRVRGKPFLHTSAHTKGRITPACAGKTRILAVPSHSSQDHPRVCGENNRGAAAFTLEVGSPPRVRGKRGQPFGIFKVKGITPACAGKTTETNFTIIDGWDHPRVCGENLSLQVHSKITRGSPPRVRGKLGSFDEITFSTRITPACAGKTPLI